mgnify:CR=1 FL=1
MSQKLLYKFREWSNPYHQKLLKAGELWLSSAKEFNDPFDCRYFIDFKNLQDDDALSSAIRVIRRIRPDLREEAEIKEEAKHLIENADWRNPVHHQEHKESVQNRIFERIGVCSFSAKKDEIMLWSHYGDFHKGFCIGLDREKLAKFNIRRSFAVYEVDYVCSPPTIGLLEMGSKIDDFIKALTTKFKKWTYEEEFRLIATEFVDEPLILECDIFSELILGCEMPEEHEEEILTIVKNKPELKVKIFKAKKCDSEYKLVFEEISW